jgi:hypothetical protein
MADKWIFKGQLIALDTRNATATVELDAGFGQTIAGTFRLKDVPRGAKKAPLAAQMWVRANAGKPIIVESTKDRNGEYEIWITSLEDGSDGIALNLQMELADLVA